MRRTQVAVLWILVAALVGTCGVVSAKTWEIEVAGGANFAQPELYDDGVTAAVRIGRTTSKSTAFDVTIGYIGNDLVETDGTVLDHDRDTFYLELNQTLVFNNNGRARPAVSFGAGWAWTDIEPAYVNTADGRDDNSFIANGAIKLEFWVAPNFAIIPAIEARWFEGRHGDDFDAAATLGFAFRFNP